MIAKMQRAQPSAPFDNLNAKSKPVFYGCVVPDGIIKR